MTGKKRPQEDRFAEIDEHDQPTEPMARVVLSPLSPTPGEPSALPWQNRGYSSPSAAPNVPQPGTYVYPSNAPVVPGMGKKQGQPARKAHKQPRTSALPGLVGVFFVAVQLLLLVRFVLQLFVQPGSTVAVWEGILYSVSSVFLLPFRLLLQNISVPAAIGSQLISSLTILLAILIYGLLSRILVRFLKALLNTR